MTDMILVAAVSASTVLSFVRRMQLLSMAGSEAEWAGDVGDTAVQVAVKTAYSMCGVVLDRSDRDIEDGDTGACESTGSSLLTLRLPLSCSGGGATEGERRKILGRYCLWICWDSMEWLMMSRCKVQCDTVTSTCHCGGIPVSLDS
jgi:hypothetical protein